MQGAGFGRRIAAGVFHGCLAKVVLGLDALRSLCAAIVITELGIEPRVGGSEMKLVQVSCIIAAGAVSL